MQPFLKSLTTEGEWPLIFFDGQFNHAASKRVVLPEATVIDELFAHETNTAHTATADQIEVAQLAMDLVSSKLGTPTYGRVDLARDRDGQYCVLEVELNEPSLFLPCAGTGAAKRLAAALTR